MPTIESETPRRSSSSSTVHSANQVGGSDSDESRDGSEDHRRQKSRSARDPAAQRSVARGLYDTSREAESSGGRRTSDDENERHTDDMASYTGKAAIKGKSETIRMILLTFNGIGITFTWGVEMTYCTPYLLNLGLTKSNTSLVWIAGPLSGLIVQPIVGVLSDESTSRWGRRRPMMVLGALIVAGSLLTLGFTKEIVGLAVHDEEAAKRPTIVLAVLAIYCVDFAINAIMSCSRSLIVDTLPIEKQQSGAAWASRMNAIGNLVGYGAGALDLMSIFGSLLGDSQFQQLTVIATAVILSTVAVTCWAVTERVLVTPPSSKRDGKFQVVRQIWRTVLHLPPRIQAICWAQFWSWIGWFPFLFYSTTWVGETYFRYDVPSSTKSSKDVLGDIGRIGSISLVIYSSITFVGAFALPLLVKSPDEATYTPRAPTQVLAFLERFNARKPSLLTTWIWGHVIFSCSMALAPFATSFRFATILVAICGLPWTIAMWAPTAFLGVEVNRLSGANDPQSATYQRLQNTVEMTELASSPRPSSPGAFDSTGQGHRDSARRLEQGPDDDNAGTSSTGELSGIYFGILNIYTTLPQFVGTFLSTIVFAILEPGKSPELAADPASDDANKNGPNAIAVCLFIGAMSTLGAAYATRQLKSLM